MPRPGVDFDAFPASKKHKDSIVRLPQLVGLAIILLPLKRNGRVYRYLSVPRANMARICVQISPGTGFAGQTDNRYANILYATQAESTGYGKYASSCQYLWRRTTVVDAHPP